MKFVSRRLLIKQIIFSFILVYTLYITNVLAQNIEKVSEVKFHTYVAGGGDYQTIMDTKRKMLADYLKVEIKAKKGDTYDVRFKYSDDWLDSTKTIAVKKGLIGKKSKKSIIYFIPEKGICPGKTDQCVKVPVIKGISTKTKLIDSEEIIYGIEIYNGSLNLLMETEGKYTFVKYK